MKMILFLILIIIGVVLSGCTSTDTTTTPTITPTPEIYVPTPIITTQATIETPTPTPTVNECFDRNITTPSYCYDKYYWVRPTYAPINSGYTARVSINDTCTIFNRTSNECEQYGDGSYTVLALLNQTGVRNLTGINSTEVVAMLSYYNRTYDLNRVYYAPQQTTISFQQLIDKIWDGTYPSTKYSSELFAPDTSVDIPIVNDTFNPDAF